MTSNFFAALALGVTALGWVITYLSQRKQTEFSGKIQQLLSEHETRFTYLHKRRSEVIDELYKTMDLINRSLRASFRAGRYSGEPAQEEERADAFKKFISLQESFYQNRLYFDEEFCSQLEGCLQRYFSVFLNFGVASEIGKGSQGVPPGYVNQAAVATYGKLMEEAAKIALTDLPPIQKLIEDRMRQILGGEPPSKGNEN